ncbi:hypothetical protein OROGR_015594 [Orobanche gracilis]
MQSISVSSSLSFPLVKQNMVLLNPNFNHRFDARNSTNVVFPRLSWSSSTPPRILSEPKTVRFQFRAMESAGEGDKSGIFTKTLWAFRITDSIADCVKGVGVVVSPVTFLKQALASRALQRELIMKKKFEDWVLESEEDESIVNKFEEWMLQYGRVYKDANEKKKRYLGFKETLQFVEAFYTEAFNNGEDQGFTVGLNGLSDMTYDEYQSTMMGCIIEGPHTNHRNKRFGFGHGQSNPTFLLEVHSGSLKKHYVMRKKPPGKLLESAHAVEREFQVLHALGTHTLVPVPKVYCLCTDSSVIGTAFYIMEYLEGRIYIYSLLPDVEPRRRSAIYRATAKALASLHSVDVDAIGLRSYGKPNNYCKRQVEIWGKQYLFSTGDGKSNRNPRMLELSDWLRRNIPLEDSSGAVAGLVHGDFRIDNLVFHPTEDRVIGILDWELSTLGNQMCDVAYSCLHYFVDISLDKVEKYGGLELAGIPEGIPSLADYLADYCAAAGKPWPAANWKFYVAFSLFRGASIYAGVHCRWILVPAIKLG